jgi:hypothetical protein
METPMSNQTKTSYAQFQLAIDDNVCRLMANDIGGRLQLLFQLALSYANVAIVIETSATDQDYKRYILSCPYPPLQIQLEALLCAVGWTKEGTWLISPNQPEITSSELINLINDAKASIIDYLSE